MDDDQPIINENESNREEEESFADMFEAYTAGMQDDIQVGDQVRGKIISISNQTVFVDTGTKADGIVEIEELTDASGQLTCAVGDEIELFVVSASESEIRLSKAIAGVGGLSMLNEAYANAIPVEGKVVQTIKGGFQVEVLQRRAFCPISQMDTQYIENAEAYVGQTFSFRISKLTEGGRNIVLSRRALLEAEQRQAREDFLKTLQVDQIHTGRVTRLMPFGAFVELAPGLEGMVHISELSWSRIEKPEEAVTAGDQVDVKVLAIQSGEKGRRIALSVKQVTGDPWDRLGDRAEDTIQVGQKLTGKVSRCAPFGAFVELRPGVDGLVHISEMSYTKRILDPREIVQPGQTVAVMVKEVDLNKRRIGLSMRDAEGDPWLDVAEKFTPGQPVTGTLEKQEKFGLFVSLMPGVVGLLPQSVINRSPQGAALKKLRSGDTLTVVIETINPQERKISLGLGDSDDEGNWKQYSPKTQAGPTNLGSLGDKLAEALKKQ